MNTGKGVYIEGSDFGADHTGTDFFEYFGCALDSDVTTNIGSMTGVPSTITSGMNFSFTSGGDENYSVDAINATEGTDIFASIGNYNRTVVNNSTGLTICSTPVLGGFIDGTNTRTELLGIYLDFLLVDPGVPAIPDYAGVIPDPTGALSCEIQWYNPLLDFSGDPLTELLEMRLYRDGELIFADTDPEIGGYDTYIDVPAESGIYNYMIAGYNSLGEGPGATFITWVGEDVPNVVENLVLEDVGGQAYITWTNPTTGLNGGAFNNPITGFNIVRSDGEIFELQSLATEYTDATITSGIFYYTVQPYNLTGDGGSATSNSIFFGDGSVFNVFIQCDDYGSETTWDVVDDGGSVLFSGGPYTANEIVDVDCILAAGDYIFTIYDSYGDGICCAYGEGYYTLSLDETVILDGNGEFGTEASTPFTVEAGVVLDPPNNLAIVSNPSEDFATFTWDAPIVDDITGYDVYLDYVLQGNTADLEWEFNELANGTLYEAGVVAVYDEGTSAMATLEFTFEGTDADDIPELITALQNNYPNPFNPTTKIAFSIDETEFVTLEIYNIKGEKVKTLVDSELAADSYRIEWDSRDNGGKVVASGVYFYKMKVGKFQETKKMILLK